MAKSSTVKKSKLPAKSKKTIVNKVAKKKVVAKAKVKTTKVAIKKPVKAAKKPVKTVAKAAAKKPAVKAAVKKPAVKAVAKVAPKAAVKQAVKPVVKPVAKVEAAKPAAAPQVSVIQNSYDFKVNDYLVYPTHGVGNVVAIEKTEIAGTPVTLYVLNFEKEKMTLRVPVSRAASVGLRRLSSSDQISKAITVLKGKPKTARGMWSRRATEYGQKINSGNIEAIAQVVRDLHKNVDDPDRSYSERVIYESAFDRLCGEYAAVNKIDTKQAQEILVKALNKKVA